MEWIAHIHLATRLLSDRATLLPLRVQTKDAATAAAGRVTNCARSLLSEHFSSSYRSGQPGHKASSNAMRCAAPCSMLHPCDITQRTTKLKLRGSDNCRHYTNHGSHTCRPTELALARSREEEVGNRRKRVSGSGSGQGGMGSRQRQIIESLPIDVRSAISVSPAVTVPIFALTMMSTVAWEF